MKRYPMRWGTKRHAPHTMRHLMRAWAKAKRSGDKEDRDRRFGEVLGARTALMAVGALSEAQYQRINRRVDLIINARVTRGPSANWRAAA